jgi:hypothetical protein
VTLWRLRIEVVDHGCGVWYRARFCTEMVDGIGNPVGGPACGDWTLFANPTNIENHPVACGFKQTLEFERVGFGGSGLVDVVANPGGACTKCPSQAPADTNN